MTAEQAWLARWRVPIGYPVALIFLVVARPIPASLASGFVVAALGLLLRAAAAGRLRKFEELATTGPFGWTRNPLYLGSAILATGFVIAGASWIGALFVTAYLVFFYPAVTTAEEEELRQRYGAAYDSYAKKVPLFWPRRLSGLKFFGSGFSWAQYRRNREYQATIGALLAFAILVGDMLWRGY